MRLYKHIKKGNPAYADSPWWCDFSVSGKRFRLSLDTSNKVDARRKANEKHAQALAGKLSADSSSFARLTFIEAADRYLTSRRAELQESSYKKEAQLLKQPRAYFGITRLSSISREQVLDYRLRRGKTCGAAMLNMECGAIRRILRRGKLWAAIADDIRPLKEPETCGRALTPEEKATLLEIAASRPEWETCYYATVIALSSGMRGAEIRGLRWSDVDFVDSLITIRKGKTAASSRTIPLTRAALDVFVKLRERSELFGAVSPDHYVFASYKPTAVFKDQQIAAHRLSGFDPSKPMKSWKKAWRSLTQKAGIEARFHDLRHTVCTELLESGASEQTVRSLMGHVSQRMLDRYSHIRLQARRQAIEVLNMSIPGAPSATIQTAPMAN